MRARARTQSQVALSADARHWFLLNASPDLRAQIEATPELHPRESPRSTPIGGVVLTNADLDHVLGLLLLREFQPLRIYSTAAVRRILTEDNSVFGMLRQFPEQLQWDEIRPGVPFEPTARDGTPSGLRCEPIAVPWGYPAYVTPERKASLPADEAVLGLVVTATASGKRLAFFPGLSGITDEWLARVAECDVLIVDGTFWSDDELVRTRGTRQDGATDGARRRCPAPREASRACRRSRARERSTPTSTIRTRSSTRRAPSTARSGTRDGKCDRTGWRSRCERRVRSSR